MPRDEPPRTRLTLLGALRQGLRWEEFVALYGRLILAWGRRDFGLQESDAENLCQEVLIRVWKGIAGYDPARGPFRAWLYTCTRNAVSNLRRAGPRERLGAYPEAAPDRLPARPVPWEGRSEDWRPDESLRALEEEGFAGDGLQDAVRRVRAAVRPSTWKAFLLFEFFELPSREIGPHLGMTPAAVNQAV